MSIRILLVDDHENVRIGFRLVLDSQPDMTVVGEAARGTAGLELARDPRPDVVLAGNIQAKLGVRNRVGIAAWAWSTGQVNS